ncbi:MAG: porin [Flavobacteriia bacterium]|nr:porin [Flavobacteriia bacterium]
MIKSIFLYAVFIQSIVFAQEIKFDSLDIHSKSNDTTDKIVNGFNLNGYIDVNYFQNTNNPQNGSNLGKSGYARAFDQKCGQFQIGLVQTKITYTHSKSEAIVDLVFGPHADLANYGNVIGPLGGTSSLAIKQAYFNWRAHQKIIVTAGQFITHIGYEVVDAPLNYHYSLSNLFTNGPYYHIGTKIAYCHSDKIALMVGLVNNWDNLYDNNQFKTIISQVSYTPSEKAKLYINYIGGNETTMSHFNEGDKTHGFKQLIDIVGNFQITPKFYIGINGALGKLGFFDFYDKRVQKYWGGAALYLNYNVSKKISVGTRVDYLDNTQNVQYIGATNVVSSTLTGVIKVSEDHLHIKPEIRFDNYKKIKYSGPATENVQQFMDAKGNYTLCNQLTLGLALVYKF